VACVPALILAALGAENPGVAPATDVVEARPGGRPREDARAVPQAAALDLTQLRRSARAGEPADAFASKSWYVPPPPPPPPVKLAPPPPTAPPLPFTYLGRYEDSGKPVYFLFKGGRILTVKQGDIIEGKYRVEGAVGSHLGLTYLPLNIRQDLDTGNAG